MKIRPTPYTPIPKLHTAKLIVPSPIPTFHRHPIHPIHMPKHHIHAHSLDTNIRRRNPCPKPQDVPCTIVLNHILPIPNTKQMRVHILCPSNRIIPRSPLINIRTPTYLIVVP